MAKDLSAPEARCGYVGGRFVLLGPGQADGEIIRSSPRDTTDVTARIAFRRETVDEAVACARAAFGAWSSATFEQRRTLLVRLGEKLSEREGELSRALAREVGKPLWEAKSEVSALRAKIDVTLSAGMALVEPREVAPGQTYSFRPLGVAAVIGPFNFPLHLVHGHVVPLLATGNTVVVKPSELAPWVSQLYAECVAAAGFPPGVFNLVQGDGAVGARLSAHPDVDGVMLTGSYVTGQAVKRATLDQPHKLLALELGGRNPAIVLSDASLEKAVHDVAWGAFVTCGQRCSGTAVALVARELVDAFVERLVERTRQIVVGDPMREGVFMGPLISPEVRERFHAALSAAQADGVEALLASHVFGEPATGAFVTPSVHRVHKPTAGAYGTEELFGPDVAVQAVASLEEAILLANQSPYGLSASVFTQDEAAFEAAASSLRYGCVNLNAPTCGASSRLPFGGLRRSGNYRPAALFSTLYSTYAVASLRGKDQVDTSALSPGFFREST